MKYDYLIVGSGLFGAVFARKALDSGKTCLVLEKRSHIGGNMYDHVDPYGIRVHDYGPHAFHTDRKELFDYVRRFADWDDFRLKCGAEINGICTPAPFNFRTIDDFYPPEDAERLRKLGADAVLVGEALMRSADKSAMLAEMRGTK